MQKRKQAKATRGLKTNHNHRLKGVFKAAATSACGSEPFKQQYEALLAQGIDPTLARLTVARGVGGDHLSDLEAWRELRCGEGGEASGVGDEQLN